VSLISLPPRPTESQAILLIGGCANTGEQAGPVVISGDQHAEYPADRPEQAKAPRIAISQVWWVQPMVHRTDQRDPASKEGETCQIPGNSGGVLRV